ncbi:MAG: DNA alkylation repair protein [Lentisphaerae bacterium]|nr:DNA alkylation repair protein [Lentisphaerota bacterium]
MPPVKTADDVRRRLRRLANRADARILQRFFKTGPGEYGAGDVFLGIRVPALRKLAAECDGLSLRQAAALLKSPHHEARLLALLVMIRLYRRAGESGRGRLYALYLRNTRRVNNWDLVDLSAPHIVGAYLDGRDPAPLRRLAKSRSLWERRIAMLATHHFIRRGEFRPTLDIARMLLHDEEDLIHKAAGWMLREVGKRDSAAEERFLKAHCRAMPRTMLRYAIERFPRAERLRYRKGCP